MNPSEMSQTKQYPMTEAAQSRVIAVETLKPLHHTLLVTVDLDPCGAEGCPQARPSILTDTVTGLRDVPHPSAPPVSGQHRDPFEKVILRRRGLLRVWLIQLRELRVPFFQLLGIFSQGKILPTSAPLQDPFFGKLVDLLFLEEADLLLGDAFWCQSTEYRFR